ncbi:MULTISPECIES: hypothetical protein [unclassified Tolypothrix]|uniref:hypothetical protein n=1 Tax=unclassified Tolypothrix TaxID=2649714 RepID=UPI0005EABF14|nr:MULTISPECIES: hypothetical protein [unclassified Tolypothrix]EKF05878.1 folylpolyglutamate synthase [Tolypothrix sp. PCC 7601]MBE9081522.1 hypothetical protein [Tolypothrix sp. LEGE 11397]UYD26688.1 hypothetical protein HGR01_00765 [Tolypothrix sp. PCC 7712]UYD37451.1 hypothetical protein HG267_18040 [Tolypothrix sp. PCC 7601]
MRCRSIRNDGLFVIAIAVQLSQGDHIEEIASLRCRSIRNDKKSVIASGTK